MFQVLLFEGIPGSGKTTLSKRVEQYLKQKGYNPIIIHEGDIHPIDLAWCSYMDEETFQQCLSKYKHLQEDIMKQTTKKGDIYITSYTKVRISDKKDITFYQDFSNHEIYKLDNLTQFKDIHKALYSYFNQHINDADMYIFECILLQNHLNEMILHYNKDQEYIIEYFNELLEQLKDVKMQIIHLQQANVPRDLKNIIDERKVGTMNIPKDWIDLVVDYLDRQPYAKTLGYQGVEGVYKYYQDRQEIEKKIIPFLHTNVQSFVVNQNYDNVYDDIIKYLEKHWM